MNKFYMVSFADGTMRFFQNLEMAKDYVWCCYIRTFPNSGSDTYYEDRNMLNNHNMIEDFVWIDPYEFEDQRKSIDKFYVVSFTDGTMRIFQNLEKAKDCAWSRYIKIFPHSDTDTRNHDRDMLDSHGMIEDFVWINPWEFEDDKFAEDVNL